VEYLTIQNNLRGYFMKIAIPVFHFHKKGGIERHIWELVSRWEKENEIHIFANRWDENYFADIFHRHFKEC